MGPTLGHGPVQEAEVQALPPLSGPLLPARKSKAAPLEAVHVEGDNELQYFGV
jgi:hypothetical protein